MDTPTSIATAAFLFILFLWARRPKSSVPLPPGPKPIPVIGNIRDLTPKQLWVTATKWSKQYGDVCYVHVFGQGLVFLCSPEAAFDLLDKRGSIYSDKPYLVMTGELVGCKRMVAFTGYGDESKRQRRLMHRALGIQTIAKYNPLVEYETKAFLHRLLLDSSNYSKNLRRYTGGLGLQVLYGYQVEKTDDEFLTLAEETVDLLANKVVSGGGIWPVDVFPSLKHLPMWFPGAGFKRSAVIWKAMVEDFVDRPYEWTKSEMRKGTAVSSFCTTLLEQDSKTADEQYEDDVKWTANSMYSGSADTTMTLMTQFILAMIMNPEVLAKAHEEIDRVVGNDRLPTFEDRPNLPYIECVMNESLRWGPSLPLSLPHRLMEDNVYRGMFIPKGSLIFGNIWAILRDEKLYPNPYVFNPDRFMEKADPEMERRRDPRNYVFGFGRRRCPGANLVETSAWLLMVCMLATLDMTKAVDDKGNIIEPKIEYDNSVFGIPNPFECSIKPRSVQAAALMRLTTEGRV
jgi:cytochrome P450